MMINYVNIYKKLQFCLSKVWFIAYEWLFSLRYSSSTFIFQRYCHVCSFRATSEVNQWIETKYRWDCWMHVQICSLFVLMRSCQRILKNHPMYRRRSIVNVSYPRDEKCDFISSNYTLLKSRFCLLWQHHSSSVGSYIAFVFSFFSLLCFIIRKLLSNLAV
jgi:hypothetical protein